MAVLLKCGAVFLHIPKTGGSWVLSALQECDLVRFRISHKHADVDRVLNYRRYYPGQYLKRVLRYGPSLQRHVREAYSFCFVRHPLDWYESYFKFMSSLGWRHFGGLGQDPWHPNAELFDLGADEFNDFMRNIVDRCPGYASALFARYTAPPTDFVGRQESLVDDLVTVLEALDVRFDEDRLRRHPRTLVSAKPSRPIVWDEALRAQVMRLEQAGLQRYGYAPAPDAAAPQTT